MDTYSFWVRWVTLKKLGQNQIFVSLCLLIRGCYVSHHQKWGGKFHWIFFFFFFFPLDLSFQSRDQTTQVWEVVLYPSCTIRADLGATYSCLLLAAAAVFGSDTWKQREKRGGGGGRSIFLPHHKTGHGVRKKRRERGPSIALVCPFVHSVIVSCCHCLSSYENRRRKRRF